MAKKLDGTPLNQSPRSRRPFHRDVEQEEFQYASSHCLSSYYSVFVARLAIMVMLAILIGLLTLLTWHFTRVYTAKSLENLAFGLRYEILQRPILRMWNILNSTVEITTAQVRLSEYVIRRHSNPVNQAQQVELYEVMRDVTWALFASRKALNAITINYRNGFVQAFHRDRRSNSTFYIYSDLVNYSISGSYGTNTLSSLEGWSGNISAIWYREPLDPATGEKIGKARKIPPDDLINIAGYSQVPDGAASWHVAVSKYTDSPLLSAALPVWDSAKENIVAVVGVTTALYSVGQLMKELVEFHSGHIYLTSQEGWLLATSTNAPLLKNSTTGTQLMMAVDSEDHVIRMGAELLKRAYGNQFPPSHEVHVENARLGHQLYYIDSFFLNLQRLPMVGVIIIPRKYVMGKVDERAFKTLVILISASLCILAVGCVCIFILTNGVSKEMKLRAELISHLDARRKAEASSNYKSQFLANMSHELRTPMAAVIGLLDILMCDDCLTNEQYATITQIRKCSTALLRLLNNILDLSKVESGKLVLKNRSLTWAENLKGWSICSLCSALITAWRLVLDLSDDMPRLVQGDSARVVQIFANLISNSIKFTTSGYIVLRGWCENPNTYSNTRKFPLNQKESRCMHKMSLKQHTNHMKRSCKKEDKVVLWFEVDDTGCGIDPSKWESVFESFEQADPSTTRTHGGTGLGLCIVRTLVNKMGGEIKVVKKNGPGTLMQLYLLLNTPPDTAGKHCSLKFTDHSLMVLLALNGRMGRSIMSQWLQKNQVFTLEASEWHELTQILREIFQAKRYEEPRECSRPGELNTREMKDSVFIIVVDISLLDLNTDLWREQLNFLNKYYGKAKFAWILNHDTSNTVKMELRRKGHLLMVNRPFYQAKMVQILEAAIKERNLELQKKLNTLKSTADGDSHECLEIDPIQYDAASSDDSDKSEMGSSNPVKESHILKPTEFSNTPYVTVENCVFKSNGFSTNDPSQVGSTLCDRLCSGKVVGEHKSLGGLRILLAEDTPVLQRVATIMLEKLGATVVAVGDGRQAVDSLKITPSADGCRRDSPTEDYRGRTETEIRDGPPYDLIVMDCQMPKMDGYEATKEIRKSEMETGSHIPIVALTAHAMSSDEAKCLEVGMDAYLTKPIDCKQMVSTILSLTRRSV
ncbi:histidine kinase 1 [Actinidia rufa]|uniref:histidine kinase n=1 Tax=Actinidia rufa TaxID=165716 RepID=A0A7J0EN44_9ERIC|nr:histidine kinase 1 [Actinidia rufa]